MTSYGLDVVSNVQYGAANEMLGLTWLGHTETRTYNNRLQLTRKRIGPAGLDSGLDIQYNYPSAPANNGRIASQVNGTYALTQETISYQYDALNRLTQTVGPDFTQSYSFDGFGNLTARTGMGTAPSSATPVDPATNRLSGVNYDANGNEARTGSQWDAESRLYAVGSTFYLYDSGNHKIWEGVWNGSTYTSQKITFYGLDGRRMGEYTPVQQSSSYSFNGGATDVYFAGKRLALEDRLGSDSNGKSDYFPFGETRFTYTGQVQRFATYPRDNATGLDYAINQHYMPGTGRFTSADPYRASGGPSEPGSWNRYSYTRGDPIDLFDPGGLQDGTPTFTATGYCYGCSRATDTVEAFYTRYDYGIGAPGVGGGWDRGGGASGSWLGPVGANDREQTDLYRQKLGERIGRLGDCQKILGGTSTDDFRVTVNKMQYFDGRPEGPGSGRSQNDVSGNGVSMSLAATVQYNIAAILPKDGSVSPYVVLGRDFYGDSTVSQGDVLLHEALHYALNLGGKDDADLKQYLSNYGFKSGYGGTGGTDDITQWLKANCPDLRKPK